MTENVAEPEFTTSLEYWYHARELALAKNYDEAARYISMAIEDKDWVESYFDKSVVTNPDFDGYENAYDENGECPLLGKKAILRTNGNLGLHEYYVFDEDVIDYYEFKLYDSKNPQNSVIFDFTPDGKYLYNEVDYVDKLYKSKQNIARNSFAISKQLMREGKFEEAGTYLATAMNDKEWCALYFNKEEVKEENLQGYPGSKRVVQYWAYNYGQNVAAVLKYYTTNTEEFDYYVVRVALSERNSDVLWIRYSPDGEYLEDESEYSVKPQTIPYESKTEMYKYGKERAGAGYYEEAGKLIAEAMLDENWVNGYFDITVNDNPTSLYEDFKKKIDYYVEEYGQDRLSISAYYLKDTKHVDYYSVKIYKNNDKYKILYLKIASDGSVIEVTNY